MPGPTRGRLFTEATRQHEVARLPRDLLKDLEVLVVDDDEDSLELLSAILHEYGAHVLKARSAKAGVKIVETIRVNIVVSDWAMAGEDGVWLIQQVRQLPPHRGGNIPAVAVTACPTRYGRDRAAGDTFEAYFTKPIDLIELIRWWPSSSVAESCPVIGESGQDLCN